MKLVVSVMPKNLEEAQNIDSSRYDDADIIEWRADFLAKDDILTVAPAIFEKFAGRELMNIFLPLRKSQRFISQTILILNIFLTKIDLRKCWIFQILF